MSPVSPVEVFSLWGVCERRCILQRAILQQCPYKQTRRRNPHAAHLNNM